MPVYYDVLKEDLPPDMRDIADCLGLDQALKLAEALGPGSLYLPNRKRLILNARNRAISSEFNGSNYKELAKKHHLTVSWIRKIVHEK